MGESMRVSDIRDHFLSRADWVDSETTVDRVIRGNPEADVDRCMVSWMPGFTALREMVKRNLKLMICHEAIFWRHRPDRPDDNPVGQEKYRFIQEHDLVILRNHDCWDVWPEAGIPWAWGRYLGIKKPPTTVGASGFQYRYDIELETLDAFAKRVAEKCADIGEPLVQVMGNESQTVSRIGIGTGCACDIPTYQDMGCDCSIVCDDGSQYCSNIQRAADSGHPIIRVSHGTSEEPGMVTLTKYINDNIDGLRAEHLPHGSSFRLVGTSYSKLHTS